jgi:hypothetical protein
MLGLRCNPWGSCIELERVDLGCGQEMVDKDTKAFRECLQRLI